MCIRDRQIMWVSLLAASLDMRESFAPVKIWNNSLWMLFAEMVRRDIKWLSLIHI